MTKTSAPASVLAPMVQSLHFQILLYPGFDELDALAPFEVLSMAARALAKAEGATAATWCVELVALDDVAEVIASHGLRVALPARRHSTAPPTVLIVPGGGWVDRARVGARTEYERGDGPGTVAHAARIAHENGVIVASVCTGAMLLARAGLLRGRRATTHHAAMADLEAHDVSVVRSRVVDDGDMLTAGGVTSGIDLALHLVERFAHASLADAITATLEYARERAAIVAPTASAPGVANRATEDARRPNS